MTYARLDRSVLDRIAQDSPQRAGRLVAKLARDTEAYAKSHMSRVSPSPEGDPPGIDTGNLVNNVLSEQIRTFAWRCFIPGERVPYAIHLEYGTHRMAARPFMAPAFMAIVNSAPPGLFAEVVTG